MTSLPGSALAQEGVDLSRAKPTQAGSPPPVGVNLEPVADWARLMPFVDLMKASRAWGTVRKPWDHAVEVDALGWPTRDAGVIVRIGGSDKGDPHASATRYLQPGVYQLSFTGRARVRAVYSSSIYIRNYAYEQATNRSTAEIVIGASATQLLLTFEKTVDGVRDVKILRPGTTEGQTFTREFLEAVAPFGTLRLTDFLATNGNPVKTWSGRTTPASATQSGRKGAAWEYVVQLANEAGKDIWINVPVGADDGYVRALAEFLHSRLDRKRVVYVEFGNELWNSRQTQARENIRAAVAEALAGDVTLTRGRKCALADFGALPACDSFWAGQFRVGKRLASIHAAFAATYGRAAMNKNVRLVLSSTFPDVVVAEEVLRNMAGYRGAPKSVLYGVAVAPFYMADGDLLASAAITPEEVLSSLEEGLRRDVMPHLRGGSPVDLIPQATGTPRRPMTATGLAQSYGLQTLAFAGGPDVFEDGTHIIAKFQASTNPKSGELVKALLSQWYGCGNGLFAYYSLSGAYGAHGAWGLTNNPGDLSQPKYAALAAVAREGFATPATCN